MQDTNTLLIPKLSVQGDDTILTFVELPLPNHKVRQGRCSMKHLHNAAANQTVSFTTPKALHKSGELETFAYNKVDISYSMDTKLLNECEAILYNGMAYDIDRKEL